MIQLAAGCLILAACLAAEPERPVVAKLDAGSPGIGVLEEALREVGWSEHDAHELAKAAILKDLGQEFVPELIDEPGEADLSTDAVAAIRAEFLEDGWADADASKFAVASWTISRDVYASLIKRKAAGEQFLDDDCYRYKVTVYFCDDSQNPPVYKRRIDQYIDASCYAEYITPCLPAIISPCGQGETHFYEVPLPESCDQFDGATCIRFNITSPLEAPGWYPCEATAESLIDCSCFENIDCGAVSVECCTLGSTCFESAADCPDCGGGS